MVGEPRAGPLAYACGVAARESRVDAINALRDPNATRDPDARVLPLHRGPGVGVLREDDLERVRSATLRVLEEIGIGLGSADIRERLAAGGAEVDPGSGRVRFGRELVDEALQRAPGEMVLAARDPSCDLRVNGGGGWLSTGGPAATVVDLSTDERRTSTLLDVVATTRLADAMPQIGFVAPSVVALDAPTGSRPLHELHAHLANSSKHVQVEISVDGPGARSLVEIARAVTSDGTALRERPVLSGFVRLRSPLALGGGELEAALVLAEEGVPCGFVASPVAGTNAPVTLAGALATAGAEVVAGVVTLQLLVPGAPTFLGTRALNTRFDGGDPSPGGPGGPLFQMAWVQLARRLGLPVQLGGFATGAKSSDWQAGMDGGLSGTGIWMSGPDLLAAAGLRDGGRLFSPIAMLLDTELFDLIRQIPLGFQVDEEALALEVIEKVGPGGHFLGEPHTLRHMREAWMSRFMDKDSWEAWEEAGRPEPPKHAAEHARELLATHEPTPLPSAAEERILEVIAEHERRHG
jgi:trimethylamine--corrinoid protein Co-methyltransferase